MIYNHQQISPYNPHTNQFNTPSDLFFTLQLAATPTLLTTTSPSISWKTKLRIRVRLYVVSKWIGLGVSSEFKRKKHVKHQVNIDEPSAICFRKWWRKCLFYVSRKVIIPVHPWNLARSSPRLLKQLLVVWTPLKNDGVRFVSWDDDIPNIWEKTMSQTTNQS